MQGLGCKHLHVQGVQQQTQNNHFNTRMKQKLASQSKKFKKIVLKIVKLQHLVFI